MQKSFMFYRVVWALILTSTLSIFGETSFWEVAEDTSKVEYFAEFYSYEGPGNRASESHSFARFVKTVNGKPVEKIDISWLPKEDFIRPGGRMPLFSSVPGKNYSLEETLALAGSKTVLNHGKYKITDSLFNQAKKRVAFLNSGKVDYQMLASLDSSGSVNCIHAILGVVGDIPTGSKYGAKATTAIVEHFLRDGKMSNTDISSQYNLQLKADLIPHSKSNNSTTDSSITRTSHR